MSVHPVAGASQPCDVFIIGGCGHVGLPLGLMLARSGLRVVLCDADEARMAAVSSGRMPFLEYDAEPILRETLGRTLFVNPELAGLGASRAAILTIGTPVDEHMNPTFTPLFKLADLMAPHLRDGHQLILRSTVYPGTSRLLHQRLSSLQRSVHLSYCPERIVQGYAVRELQELPQLVSGFTPEAVEFAGALFRRLSPDTIVVNVEEAELGKLFLNAWRYIQYSIVNQFYMMAAQADLDFFRIYEAITSGYQRAGSFPKPGFTAGPCLFKDTMQLSAFGRNTFPLGYAAMLINEGLPDFIVEMLRRRFDLSKETVGILGMAFKAEVDDKRDSLAYKLRKVLQFHGATVLCSDAFIDDPSFLPAEELLRRCRIVIVGAPHRRYQGLAIPPSVHLVDIWGCLPKPPPASPQPPQPRRKRRARATPVLR
jgi:UDP-N-acetyl-D-mannosaminuronic acid dehydrogenase